eukprot:2176394-Pyramimonas_sp.AAC.1
MNSRSRRSASNSPPSMDWSGPASGEARARVADPGPGSTSSPPGGRATTAQPAQAIWAPPS